MLWIHEGYTLDDSGNLITSVYVDLRDGADRTAIPSLIKGCRREHALEDGDTLLLSRPNRFRVHGEALIQDDQEGFAKEESVLPKPLAETARQKVLADTGEAIALADPGRRINLSRTHRGTCTESLSHGDDRWIYCASIRPDTDAEWQAWRAALPDDYNHVSEIGKPALFAQALARMVFEQRGALTGNGWLRNTTSDSAAPRTTHRQQLIIHGPVVYRGSVYDTLAQMDGEEIQKIAAFIFPKAKKYADQREYRFAVLLKEKSDDETVSLTISGMMRDALTKTEGGLVRTCPSEDPASKEEAEHRAHVTPNNPRLLRQTRTQTERQTQRHEWRVEEKDADGRLKSSQGGQSEKTKERIVEEVEEPGGDTVPDELWDEMEHGTAEQDRSKQALPQHSVHEIMRMIASGETEGNDRSDEDKSNFRREDALQEQLHNSFEEMINDPATPIGPKSVTWQEKVCNSEEVARTFGAIGVLGLKLRGSGDCAQTGCRRCMLACRPMRPKHSRATWRYRGLPLD